MVSPLQQELKQRKPFTSLKHEVLLNLARTAAVLNHEFEKELKRYGLTPTQFNVLRILRGAGPDGLSQSEIGDRLVAQVPDVPRLLSRMEKARLIERRRDAEDKRIVLSVITQTGLSLTADLDVVTEQLQDRALQHLSPTQLDEFNELLYLARKK